MWGNFASSVASALERTGDVLTEKASSHVSNLKAETAATSNPNNNELIKPTIVSLPPPPSPSVNNNQQQPQPQQPNNNNDNNNKPPLLGNTNVFTSKLKETWSKQTAKLEDREEVMGQLRLGWGSVMEATQRAAEVTRDVVEKERTRLQAVGGGLLGSKDGPYRRDPSLPLDVEALRDAEVVYITDRILTLSHPSMPSSTDGDISGDRKLAAVGHLLHRRHGGRFMVWNLSEVEYDTSILEDQVLTYKFPGSPSPPLGLMLKLLMSLESWLRADERNVAALHCLTGRGRTSCVLAGFLCWMGEAGFGSSGEGSGGDPNVALEYIARCKRLSVENLTIPSQRRYMSYFSNMLDGVRPNQPPLLLKRIIMNEAPKFGKRPKPKSSNHHEEEEEEDDIRHGQLGCAPYLQIFKTSNLILTTAAAMSYDQTDEDLPFCVPSDGPISFPIETVLQGDVLIRCRHMTRRGQRISMFRAAFHTGYVPPKVLRLAKSQLDGACGDDRFGDDFFLDLIFEACDAEVAGRLLLNQDDDDNGKKKKKDESKEEEETVQNEAARRRMRGTVSTAAAASAEEQQDQTATASAYDSMLHGDSRFWDVIAERRDGKRNNNDADGKTTSSDDTKNNNNADAKFKFYGPTIGRRRDFTSDGAKGRLGAGPGDDDDDGNNDNSSSDKQEDQTPISPRTAKQKKLIETFSIGGEFDFLGNDDDKNPSLPPLPPTEQQQMQKPTPPSPPKRDELMEALMGALDDESPSKPLPKKVTEEEIIFAANSGDDDDEDEDEDNKDSTSEIPTTDDKSQSNEEEKNNNDDEDEETKTSSSAVSASSEPDKEPSSSSLLSPSTPALQSENEGEVPSSQSSVDKLSSVGDGVEQEEGLFDGDGAEMDEDFEFDDDDELEDLENFLTKASGK